MAEMAATGQTPELIRPFELERFDRFEQVGERGAASVGH
jgi:sarcosine oxidase subunit beta